MMSAITNWLHRDATHAATAHFYAEVEKQRASREEMSAAAQGLEGVAKRFTKSAHEERGRLQAQMSDHPDVEGAPRTSEVRQLVESALRRMEAAEMRRTHQ